MIAIETRADGRAAVLVEVNSETDFVARETGFPAVRERRRARRRSPRSADEPRGAAAALKLAAARRVDETRRALIAKIGENIDVRRFGARVERRRPSAPTCTARASACSSALEGGDDELARDLAMHVAAVNPRYVTPARRAGRTSSRRSARSRRAEARGEGKPPEIVAKMVEGRLRKSLAEITLTGQPFVKDGDTTVEKLLKNAKASVKGFVRYEVGGASRRSRTISSAEVMAQVEGADAVRRQAVDGNDPPQPRFVIR